MPQRPPLPALLAAHPSVTALLAGLASAVGLAPLSLWPITLLCLTLLILLLQASQGRRHAFLLGWLFGVGHFAAGLNWIAHAFTYQDAMPHWFGYGAVVLLSLYLAVYPGLATLIAWEGARRLPPPRRVNGRVPRVSAALSLLLGASWIGTEYLRATLFTGFAWNPLGIIWLPTSLAHSATLVGTYGLSGLAIVAAGALHLALGRRIGSALAMALPLAGAAAIGLLWSSFTVLPPARQTAPAIRIVQPNIGQDVKYSPAMEATNFGKLASLSGAAEPRSRLIFWPEAAIPAWLDMEPQWRARLASLLGPGDLLLTGGEKVYFEDRTVNGYTSQVLSGAHNSLWIVDARARLLGRYDKAHLVPYGEYLPMRQLLTPLGLSRLVPGDVDFWPGPGARSLPLPAGTGRPPLKMGVQICYEIIFSGHVVDQANRPDFIFNPSNDAWFGRWGPPQHLAQARLRAIEEAIPVIRSTPTGISALVDAQGRIVDSLPHRTAGFIDALLPPPGGRTLFSRVGNWAALALMLALVALAVATRRNRH
ncbi:apolipoprotein N-acyltransferase [Sphingobium algorifonticola]|uniref:apolipoprotein N-acyltransferase n=1 Tax=Sphingobium algorifonticola TaxID=2008318 RepID=UPI001F499BF6|nr:apolipoprotein N-acyltransferase [Sphingobium algorifonticola]